MVKKVEVDIYHHKSTEQNSRNMRSGKWRTCARCNGTGKVHNPNSIFDMACPTCNGKGWNSLP